MHPPATRSYEELTAGYTFDSSNMILKEILKRLTVVCMHCTKGAKLAGRQRDITVLGSRPREILLMDFLYVDESGYILVLVDSLSRKLQLSYKKGATALAAARALCWWRSRYGFLENFVLFTDRGYSPFTNGGVETTNGPILRILRTLLSEYRMGDKKCPDLLPHIEYQLNYSVSKVNRGFTPNDVFMYFKDEGNLWAKNTYATPYIEDKGIQVMRKPKSVKKIKEEVKKLSTKLRRIGEQTAFGSWKKLGGEKKKKSEDCPPMADLKAEIADMKERFNVDEVQDTKKTFDQDRCNDVLAELMKSQYDELPDEGQLERLHKKTVCARSQLFDAIIVAPPWDVAVSDPTRGLALGYESLSMEEIFQIPFRRLCRNEFFCMWVTKGTANQADHELENQGFKREATIYWINQSKGGTLHQNVNGLVLSAVEEVQVYSNGDTPQGMLSRSFGVDVIRVGRLPANRKPDELRKCIDEAIPGGLKLEIFARSHAAVDGWYYIGNELTYS
eukprot:augustus_masked-scaffold_28-processed-gene-3.89-mRNA-1 protein AED:1.00 eAED:1.00 QI:0/0/0/0/1/1/4/0/502